MNAKFEASDKTFWQNEEEEKNEVRFSSPQRKKKILDDQLFYESASKLKNVKFYHKAPFKNSLKYLVF